MNNSSVKPQKYVVCVRCFTFNHHKYIQDAMNGFSTQQTNFPFVAVIVDDASTDGNADVIRNYMVRHFNLDDHSTAYIKHHEYGDECFARHNTNTNCYFYVVLLKNNHYSQKKNKRVYIQPYLDNSEYHAICEGDDYWTDSHKIQKQVNILENNPNVMMVYTNYETVDENGNSIYREKYENYYKKLSISGDILPNLFISNFPLTFTSLFRKEIIYSENYKNAPNKIDYSLFLSAASLGDCIYLKEKTGCYRQSPNSITNKHQDLLKPLLREAYHYHACMYAKGMCKKRKIKMDYQIKLNICKTLQYNNYYGNKETMKEVLSLNKSFFIPFLHSKANMFFKKIKRRFKRIISK